MNILNLLTQGVLLGGFFAMTALGLSIAFGVLRVVNLAHGDLMTLGAYLAFLTLSFSGLSIWLSLIIVVPALAFVGYWTQRILLQRALKFGELAPLLVTFGLAVMIPNSLMELFSSDKQPLPTGSLAVASVSIGEISVGLLPLITLLLAVGLIAGVQLFLKYTTYGRYMRAAADDYEVLRIMGVDHKRIYALAMGMAFGIAAIAGVMFGARQGGVTPFDGQIMVLFAFEAVVIGGLGSLWGTLIGGIILGIAQVVAGQFDPQLSLLVGHLVFLLVLVLRPQGIISKKGAS